MISKAPSLSLQSSTDATCGASNGSATVVASGGTEPYVFNWENDVTGPTLSNVVAGNYGVTVTDANGCEASLVVTINDIGGPSLSLENSTDATCGASNGSATVVASGGTEPYVFNWENDVTGPTLSNVVAGNYGVTVTDANGCEANLVVTINDIGGTKFEFRK